MTITDKQVEDVCRAFWDKYEKSCWDFPSENYGTHRGSVGPKTKESWRKAIRNILEIFEADRKAKKS